MEFAADELTKDKFLCGTLEVLQPKVGFRAGVDSVFLAASVPAHSGDTVLELGCGAGVASLCLASRVQGVDLTGVEQQHDYADLARRNAVANGQKMAIHHADLREMPPELLQRSFDHVIANPPYYLRDRGTVASDAGREAALGEITPLVDWIDVATRRLKPKGYLTVIQDAERLPALLRAIDGRLGSIKVLPLVPRISRPAHLIVLQARKGGRAAFQLLGEVVMHQGVTHDGDKESYSPHINAVLRSGAPLVLGDITK